MNEDGRPQEAIPAVHCSLALFGDFDPAEVTRTTGLTPTHTARRDTPNDVGRFPVSDLWTLRTPEDHTFDGTRKLIELLDTVRSQMSSLREAALDRGLRVVVTVYASIPAGSESAPFLQVSEQILNQVAALGAELAVDFSLSGNDGGNPG